MLKLSFPYKEVYEVTDAIELLRVVKINPDELDPDQRIELRLNNGTWLVATVRGGKLYVDPEASPWFIELSTGEADRAAEDWHDRAQAARRGSRKQPQVPPLMIDAEALEANGRNNCQVVIGGQRGLELQVGGEVVLDFWYTQPLCFVHSVNLEGVRLRSVTLTTCANQPELVA